MDNNLQSGIADISYLYAENNQPQEQEIQPTISALPKTSRSKYIDALDDETFNDVLNKAESIVKPKQDTPEILNVDPLKAHITDLDTVQYIDETGQTQSVRLANISAVETVDKENEYFAIFNNKELPMEQRLEAKKKLDELGNEKKEVTADVSTFIGEVRANYDVVGVVPRAGENGVVERDSYDRTLAQDVKLKNKVTGRIISMSELADMSGFAVNSDNVEESGKLLDETEKNRNVSQQEYFGIKRIEETAVKNYDEEYKRVIEAPNVVKVALSRDITAGELTQDEATILFTQFKKAHRNKYGNDSDRKAIKLEAESRISTLRDKNGNWDTDKLMIDLEEANRNGLKIKLTQEQEQQLLQANMDKYGSLKGGRNGNKKDQARLARINAFLDYFGSGKRKLNDLSVRSAAAINENELTPSMIETLNDSRELFGFVDGAKKIVDNVADFIGLDDTLGTNQWDKNADIKEVYADIEKFSFKNKLNPNDVVAGLDMLEHPDKVIKSVNSKMRKAGLKKFDGDDLDDLSEQLKFAIDNIPQTDKGRKDIADLKKIVSTLNYAKQYQTDKWKDSASVLQKTAGRTLENGMKVATYAIESAEALFFTKSATEQRKLMDEATKKFQDNSYKEEGQANIELINKYNKRGEAVIGDNGFLDTIYKNSMLLASVVAWDDDFQKYVQELDEKASLQSDGLASFAGDIISGVGKYGTAKYVVDKIVHKVGRKVLPAATSVFFASVLDTTSSLIDGTYTPDSKDKTVPLFDIDRKDVFQPFARAEKADKGAVLIGELAGATMGSAIEYGISKVFGKGTKKAKDAQVLLGDDFATRVQSIEGFNLKFGQKIFETAKDLNIDSKLTRELVKTKGLVDKYVQQTPDEKIELIQMHSLIESMTEAFEEGKFGTDSKGNPSMSKEDAKGYAMIFKAFEEKKRAYELKYGEDWGVPIDLDNPKPIVKKPEAEVEEPTVKDTPINDDPLVKDELDAIDEKIAKSKVAGRNKSEEDVVREIEDSFSDIGSDKAKPTISIKLKEDTYKEKIVNKFREIVTTVIDDFSKAESKWYDEHPFLELDEAGTRVHLVDSEGNRIKDKNAAQAIIDAVFIRTEKSNTRKVDGLKNPKTGRDVYIGEANSLLKIKRDKKTGEYYVDRYLNQKIDLNGKAISDLQSSQISTGINRSPDMSYAVLTADSKVLEHMKKEGFVTEDGVFQGFEYATNNKQGRYAAGDVIYLNGKGEALNTANIIRDAYYDDLGGKLSVDEANRIALGKANEVMYEVTGVSSKREQTIKKPNKNQEPLIAEEEFISNIPRKRNQRQLIEEVRNEYADDFTNPTVRESMTDRVIEWYNSKGANLKKTKKGRIVEGRKKGQSYYEQERPMSAIDRIMYEEGLSSDKAIEFWYKNIRGDVPTTASIFKNEAKARELGKKIKSLKNQFRAKPLTDDSVESLKSREAYFNFRKFIPVIGDVNFKNMFDDFIIHTDKARMASDNGKVEIQYLDIDDAVAVNRRAYGSNKSTKRELGYEITPIYKNYAGTEEPHLIVYAESLNDGFAYIQKLKAEQVSRENQLGEVAITPDTKIKIVDLAGIPNSNKFEKIVKDAGSAQKVIYAADNISYTKNGEKKVLSKEHQKSIDEFIKTAGAERVYPNKSFKDFNEEIVNLNRNDLHNKVIESIDAKVQKIVKEKVDNEVQYRGFISTALTEMKDLVTAFTRTDGSLSTDKGAIRYNSSGKIVLNNKGQQTYRDVAHEILHHLQESTALKRSEDGGAEVELNTKEMEEIFQAFDNISYTYKTVFESPDLKHTKALFDEKFNDYLERLDGRMESSAEARRNATREVLVEMMLDKNVMEEMSNHTVKKVGDDVVLTKIEEGTLLTADKNSVMFRVMSTLSKILNGLFDRLSNGTMNIYEDSVFGRVYRQMEKDINNRTILEPNIKKIRNGALYARTQNTIKNFDLWKTAQKAAKDAYNAFPERIPVYEKIYDFSKHWAYKADEYLTSGLASTSLKKFWRFANGMKERNEILEQLSIAKQNIDKDASILRDNFIKIIRDDYEAMTEDARKGIVRLMQYDLKSLSWESMDRVITALGKGDSKTIEKMKKDALDRFNRVSQQVQEIGGEEAATMFISDIRKLIDFMVNDRFTSSTPHNAFEIANRYTSHLEDAEVTENFRIVIDEYITLSLMNKGKTGKKLFDKEAKALSEVDIEAVRRIFSAYKRATEDTSDFGTKADIGRKGDIVDPDLTFKETIAMPREQFDNLSKKQLRKLNEHKIDKGDDGWVYITLPSSKLQKQEGILTGVSTDYNIDAELELTGNELKKLNEVFNGERHDLLDAYLNERYATDRAKGHNIYATIENGKITGLKKAIPRKALTDETKNFGLIMAEEIYAKNVKIKKNFIYQRFMEEANIVSKDLKSPREEEDYLSRLKEATQKEYTEDDLPLDMVFISDKIFSHKEKEAETLFKSAEFKDKYRKIERKHKDWLPEEFANETYIRRDMYNNLVTQTLDFKFNWLSTEDAKEFRRLMNKYAETTALHKQAITLANPDTQMNNLVANGVKLMQWTGSPKLFEVKKAWGDILGYQKLIGELKQAYLKKDDEMVKKLTKELDEHPMKFYDDQGMFSTLVDGVETSGAKQRNQLYAKIAELYDSRFNDSDFKRGIAHYAGNFFFADGSKTKMFAASVLRIGDFAPRVVLHKFIYDKMIGEGKSKADALKEANEIALDQFVNARENTNSIIAAADVYGGALFARFQSLFFVSQVIAARKNPVTTAGLAFLIYEYNKDNDNASFKSRSISPISSLLDSPNFFDPTELNIPDLAEATLQAVTPV